MAPWFCALRSEMFRTVIELLSPLSRANSDPLGLTAGDTPSPGHHLKLGESFTHGCCHHLTGLRGALLTLFSAQAPQQAIGQPKRSESGKRLENAQLTGDERGRRWRDQPSLLP